MSVLVGDIGGTNTRLAIFEGTRVIHKASFVNSEMENFDQCLELFRSSTQTQTHAAVFGAAGPVVNGTIEMTNLNWLLDEGQLRNQLQMPVRLLNDFHIQALGTLELTSSDYNVLGSARALKLENIAVIGAGTGLGEAILTKTSDGWTVIPGEGGHKRFAPKTAREIELLRRLWVNFPEHVSVERVVSGPGIVNIYQSLSGKDAFDWTGQDPARIITEQALNGTCGLSQEVLEIFVDTLADEAANLVLQIRANCLYLSGGIPPKIQPIIERRFRGAFEAKGRYRSLLEAVEIRVICRDDIALEGAAYAARRLEASLQNT